MTAREDRGSILPLILGFFLLALLAVAASVALGEDFVQQRDLQDTCDGAATAAAASGGDLDRAHGGADGDSLTLTGVRGVVDAYLRRSADRREVRVAVQLSVDRTRLTLRCAQSTTVAFGTLIGHSRVEHVATSSARAAVLG